LLVCLQTHFCTHDTLASFNVIGVSGGGYQSTLNVVIAYEDLETGKRAKRIHDFLVENLGHDCQFTNQMWKFELLGIPKLREMAAQDAMMADIVIISCHGAELPSDFKAWVELWAADRIIPSRWWHCLITIITRKC